MLGLFSAASSAYLGPGTQEAPDMCSHMDAHGNEDSCVLHSPFWGSCCPGGRGPPLTAPLSWTLLGAPTFPDSPEAGHPGEAWHWGQTPQPRHQQGLAHQLPSAGPAQQQLQWLTGALTSWPVQGRGAEHSPWRGKTGSLSGD